MMRINMWSGPRNLSTAMMYSFAQRSDSVVVDEPFYAVYLAKTGLEHPMRAEILASQSQNEHEVIEALLRPISEPIFYQKHMAHHLLPEMRRDWIGGAKNVFLIRHPARVIASYGEKREAFHAPDLGFIQQNELFEMLKKAGENPIVIDSVDICAHPEATLNALSEALDIPFDSNMLHWPKGGHQADGVWAKHWYNAIHASTGFAGVEGPLPEVVPEHQPMLDECQAIYDKLRACKIT